LSSLFDVPAQLALVLSLAASPAGSGPTAAPPVIAAPAEASLEAIAPETAEGPFRFSAGIWYRALKEDASVTDADDVAGSIFCTSSGRYYVPAAAERERILAKRWDDALAARTARSFAERNVKRMAAALARPPTAGELYIAHLLGPEVAVSFIERVEAAPQKTAATQLPDLAEAAPTLLYAHGRALTLAQVYERLTQPVALRARNAGFVAEAANDRPATAVLIMKPTLVGAGHQSAAAADPDESPWRPDVAAAAGARPQ
jgi:hypothetical protein